jgi:hypothetical protein
MFLFAKDAPEVSLKLGSSLAEADIKEGDDVYFECHIKANPQAHKVTWKKNVSKCSSSAVAM